MGKLVSEHPLRLNGPHLMYSVMSIDPILVCSQTGAGAGFAWKWGHFSLMGDSEYVFISVCPIDCKCSIEYVYHPLAELMLPTINCDKCGRILSVKYDIVLGILSIKAVLDNDSTGVRVVFHVVVYGGQTPLWRAYYRDISGNFRAGEPFYIHIITHPVFDAMWKGRWGSDLLVYPW